MSKQVKDNKFREFILPMAMHTTGSIFGPLIFFGVIGYLVDKSLGTKPVCLIISVFIAFIFTNFFLYRKVKLFSKKLEKIQQEAEKEVEKNKSAKKQ